MTASANSGSQDSTCSVAIFTPNESRLVFNNLNYRHTFILLLFFLLIGVFCYLLRFFVGFCLLINLFLLWLKLRALGIKRKHILLLSWYQLNVI